MSLAGPSRSPLRPGIWQRPPQSRLPRAAESGLRQAEAPRSAPCACGGGCPTCAAQKKLAEAAVTTAPALTPDLPKLTAAPAMQIQRTPASATDVQSVDLGGGASVDAAQSKGGPDSQGGGDAQPASAVFNATMCPLSRCTFLRSVDLKSFFRVESGGIACTVYVDFGAWTGNPSRDHSMLVNAIGNPGSVCVRFDSNWSDPDCKVPREVVKTWET